MANIPGPQPDIRFCPVCKATLVNVPRRHMKSSGYKRRDGTVSEYTHTYDCTECKNRFEINQDRVDSGVKSLSLTLTIVPDSIGAWPVRYASNMKTPATT
jgi:uncharacterized protein YlaI